MTIYNALPHKEYERVFMCKTTKEIWRTFIITHQGNSQVKNYKIDLLTQEYEKFSISNEETIDTGFTRFNVIVTSLKSLDPDYLNKNHVRKFLHALPLKWRAKVTAIKEAKDLATLPLDELIGNLKVYRMVLDIDGVASKTTKEKAKVIDSGAEINLAMVPIGLEKSTIIALGIKAVKDQSQKGHATIVGQKATLLVSVENRKRTRLLLEEHGAIVKMAKNNLMTQHVS
uniref:UBN2 domain-containing protein n=1 Tax=Tanacetum cinerariifolium TaxID=118510 RepID=A0A6L2NSU0_TANCI|nr:UBN2 domain-containing protein [Tanacetum cinerariifolium]